MVPALAPTDTQPPTGAQVQSPLVTLADPAPHAVLTQSPSALTITFTRPFDPFSMTTADVDFELDQVAADGTATPVGRSVLSEPDNLFDPTTLVLTVNQPLAVGHYRLTLLGSSCLAWCGR